MIKLDKRLSCLLQEIDGDVLADIGCDHGKLSVSAVLSGKAKSVIAVDISKESLGKTIKLASEYGVGEKISCRVGDGFSPISEDVDTAVIAGVGGYEIAAILDGQTYSAKRLVLCPHQNPSEARKALDKHGYTAVKDYIIDCSGKFYPIIVADKQKELIPYKQEELRFGKNIPATREYADMLSARKQALDARFAEHTVTSKCMIEEYEEVKNLLCSK